MLFPSELDDYEHDTIFLNDPERVVHVLPHPSSSEEYKEVKVLSTWRPGKNLGSGSFGTVRLEEKQVHKPGDKVELRAVKVLSKKKLEDKEVDYRKELLALTKFTRPKYLQHHVFVEFYGWFQDDRNIFIAMEYFSMGTLANYIPEVIKEQDVKCISLRLITGLKIMHEEGFTHRDLKPENIFVVQRSPTWLVKIGDFGITKRVLASETVLQTMAGTPCYMAPELLHYVENEEDEESQSYTSACDIWSFGCVVYQMMTLRLPFPNPRDKALSKFSRGGPLPVEPLNNRTSPEGIDFIRSILIARPSCRPRAKDLIDAPWLHGPEELISSIEVPGSEALDGSRITKQGPLESLKKSGSTAPLSLVYNTAPTSFEYGVQEPETANSVMRNSAGLPPTSLQSLPKDKLKPSISPAIPSGIVENIHLRVHIQRYWVKRSSTAARYMFVEVDFTIREPFRTKSANTRRNAYGGMDAEWNETIDMGLVPPYTTSIGFVLYSEFGSLVSGASANNASRSRLIGEATLKLSHQITKSLSLEIMSGMGVIGVRDRKITFMRLCSDAVTYEPCGELTYRLEVY